MKQQVKLSIACMIGVSLMMGSELPSSALPPAEGPALGQERVTQDMIESGQLTLREIRMFGLAAFATPFNKQDGYGDGPMNPDDTTSPGGRPTLQNNGTFLRVNGLDGQTCLECHSILSNATVPARFGVGGVGGAVNNAIFQPTVIDVDDTHQAGFASFNGRFINPPFLFGSGGVQLLAKEMTADLQALKAQAEQNPGTDVALVTKGVNFGVIRYENGDFDTSGVEGIDEDLIVRAFGRKGEFPTTRAFDIDAMQFHFGMQPVEVVGPDVDADLDGVANEILIGELSALSIFVTNLESPRQDPPSAQAAEGALLFESVGCTNCHKPALETESKFLSYSFPEEPTEPDANVFYSVNLSTPPSKFSITMEGGLVIPLFADLKRHDMGDALAESFGSPLDRMFTTARLWGIADTAPYLHDGRALTLSEAILMHGGEAQSVRDAFAALPELDQAKLIAFLRTLRTPRRAAVDLVRP